jgi:hypothetical protein
MNDTDAFEIILWIIVCDHFVDRFVQKKRQARKIPEMYILYT